MVNRVIRQTAAEAVKARASASEDTLDRGQVAALLELLREAVARARVALVTRPHDWQGGA